jgi:hypothetical protein
MPGKRRMSQPLLASLTRIADFHWSPYDVHPLAHEHWSNGDYVLTEVTGTPSDLYQVEACEGNMVPVKPGDQVIGALGHREATLEGVGSYLDVVNNQMHALTSAGLLGVFTSFSIMLPRPLSLAYRGHIVRDDRKVTMHDFALRCEASDFKTPTILIVGTSMSAGKSVTGRRVCEVLSAAGLNVIGAKLTGAGRYRDIASFAACGAAEVYDFVDVGLPSTILPEAEFRGLIRPLLGHISGRNPDFLVVEAGASPLEPYNGDVAIDELGENIRCTILCASDPYAVVGVRDAFALEPDLVCGPAAQTSAAVRLVQKLTGLPAINIIDRRSLPAFTEFLGGRLGVELTRIHSEPSPANQTRRNPSGITRKAL